MKRAERLEREGAHHDGTADGPVGPPTCQQGAETVSQISGAPQNTEGGAGQVPFRFQNRKCEGNDGGVQAVEHVSAASKDQEPTVEGGKGQVFEALGDAHGFSVDAGNYGGVTDYLAVWAWVQPWLG